MSNTMLELNNYFELSAECESLDLPHGEFVARNGKAFKRALAITAILAIGIGLLLSLYMDKAVGHLLLVLGVCLALILPTILSYKCTVNKTLLREEYYVLFVKRQKEILWSDVEYKKTIVGKSKSIKLYDKNRKRLIAFDGTTVGFKRIVKLAKCSSIKELPKKNIQPRR